MPPLLMLHILKNAQELRLASKSIKQEVSKINNIYAEEFFNFGGYRFFFPCLKSFKLQSILFNYLLNIFY